MGLAELRLPAVVLAAAAATWVVTASRMDGMDAGPGTGLGSVGWFGVAFAGLYQLSAAKDGCLQAMQR